jgi:hypothetical protein
MYISIFDVCCVKLLTSHFFLFDLWLLSFDCFILQASCGFHYKYINYYFLLITKKDKFYIFKRYQPSFLLSSLVGACRPVLTSFFCHDSSWLLAWL